MNPRENPTAARDNTVALLNELAGEANPAANVTDRTSSIRITGLRTFWVGPVNYLRLETNHGIVGWGDVKGVDPRVSGPLAQSMFELLEDQNPTRIEFLWQKIYRAHRNLRGGALMVHTLAGIDQALWDITGKLWGVPVYRMLGGPLRDRIRVYTSPKARKVPPGGYREHSSNPADIEQIVNSIAAARKEVGRDGSVMYDAHSALPPATLIQLAAAIEPYDVLFIEEPGVPGNIETFKRIKEAVRVPLAAGERDRTIWEMIPYLQNRCLDILQPDCCHTGGITQMRKIATLAEAFFTPLAPHCTASNIGISASLHAIAATPMFLIHEFYPDNHGFNPADVTKVDWQMDANGYIPLPPGPGLGVEVDEKLMEEKSKQPQTYKWPGAKLPDGSISDY